MSRRLNMVTTVSFVSLFVAYCVAADEKLAPLRSNCVSSVQCVGVAVCIERVCRCPTSYTAVGNTCVHAGFENEDVTHQPLLQSSMNPTGGKNMQQNDQDSEDVYIGSSLVKEEQTSTVSDKNVSTPLPPLAGYPGHPCGKQNQCRGKSFCYKGICSCNAGAIVSGKICARIASSSRAPKTVTSTQTPRTRVTSKVTQSLTTSSFDSAAVGETCPPPLYWSDGECTSIDPETAGATVTHSSIARTTSDTQPMPRAVCKPPLVIVDGWCSLPTSSEIPFIDIGLDPTSTVANPTTIPLLHCLLPLVWVNGQCVASVTNDPALSSTRIPGPYSVPMPPLPTDFAEPPIGDIRHQSLIIHRNPPVRRCPPGEILINSVCLSTDAVVNYPTPLLCQTETQCPGGSTCLSHFCICPSPYMWYAKFGCDLPSTMPATAGPLHTSGDASSDDGVTIRRVPVSMGDNRPRVDKVPLRGRCRRDSDCADKAVCEFNTCACRAPFVPYLSTCIFA